MTSSDLTGAGDRWIPQDEYNFIKAHVPILSVDFIPLSHDQPPRVGLIRRETYGGDYGWCVVGGAVLRNEPLLDAVDRHIRVTLGNAVEIDMEAVHPIGVIEYFTEPDIGEFYDPRKHSVAPTYFGRCGGSIRPCGEAIEFRWFQLEELPALDFGFGQQNLITRLVRARAFG